MTMTDPIADLLTRIRNINRLGRHKVRAPYSRLKEEIVKVLEREGFISGYEVTGELTNKELKIDLKYGPEGETVITRIERVSRPGCRVYRKVKDFKPVVAGMGIAILSTPRGILSDSEAKKQSVGGEVLCTVY